MRKFANNYAFIDSQNMNLAIRSQGWALDFRKFRRYLARVYHISKAFLFLGYRPEYEPLYTALRQYGYILIFKPTIIDSAGGVKGNVDAELVLHCILQYDHFDAAIIISGDGDFHCLVECLRDTGKLLKLMIPNKHKFSSLLKEFMSEIVFMNNLRSQLAYEKRGIANG